MSACWTACVTMPRVSETSGPACSLPSRPAASATIATVARQAAVRDETDEGPASVGGKGR